jgi:hypothetical protein
MYGKIFESMYDGTLGEHWEALVTFQQMIVLSDSNGDVDMTINAIHRRTSIPKDILEAGIEYLMQDDPDSRTPAENGKRIIPVDEDRAWGWRIINYKFYAKLASYEDKKEKERLRIAGKRKKLTGVDKCCDALPDVRDVGHINIDINKDKEKTLCPQQKLVDLYHEVLPELPSVKVWSNERRAALRARWNEKAENSDGLKSDCIEWWEGFFKHVHTSDFLMGKVENGDRPFCADFEWLIKKSNFIKIIEGKYHK